MKTAHPALLLAAGALLIFSAWSVESYLSANAAALNRDLGALNTQLEMMESALSEMNSLKDMKDREMNFLTSGLSSMAAAKKTLYESGLALQAEKRLLEKQLEIMTSSLRIDLYYQKVSLMREDNSQKDLNIAFTSTQAVTEQQMKSKYLRVTSKERFAHPERGKAEEKDGVLTWIPPQVGESARSNALGEFVMFTNSNIIIHGPFKKPAEHEAYPHTCLGLSQKDAAHAYRKSFIGNRVYFVNPTQP
ncbi:MAG: hypothetical protein A2901_06820 [Elusimicrobia bacterium RIFCSPLOWO2_01_FULL_54_10]|nr:MAG: hypothetical protein A2901_06820 [Elusimicrobia bacterium RIFCSPLOWO2_01_FULL_54_10]